MPVWLQIVVTVVGAIGTICGILGITAYISERQKHRASKKNKAEDEADTKRLEEQRKLEEMKHLECVTEIKTIITEALVPVAQKLTDIENDLGLVKNGLQKDLYIDLENLYKGYCKKSFASLDEKRNYDSLYWAYHNLGKNGIADGMYEHVMKHLPEVKPTTKKRTKAVN